MANKTKLTPELQEKIVTFLRRGNYVETAAACVGIHRDTFYDWMKRGARGDKRFVPFAEAVHKAMAEAEATDLAIIQRASTTQWQAAAWRLERRHPDKWSRNDRTKVEARVEVSDDQLLGKLARLLAGGEKAEGAGEPDGSGTDPT